MGLTERIIAGDEVFMPQIITGLPKGWEAAFVFDPNSAAVPSGHPSQDVLAWLVSKECALLMVLDGVSKGQPGTLSATYDSGPVAVRFAQEALALAKPHLKAQRPFELSEMHYKAGHAIRQARSNEEAMPEGGLVGISTLLLPNGHTQTHHFGDPHTVLSTNPENPGSLSTPEELWPENRAKDLYLAKRAAVEAGNDQWSTFDPEGNWIQRMLIPPRNDPQQGNVTHHASTTHGLRKIHGDHRRQIPPNGSHLMATDGLGLYQNPEALQDAAKRSILALLGRAYMYGKPESNDNIAACAVRWNPENP